MDAAGQKPAPRRPHLLPPDRQRAPAARRTAEPPPPPAETCRAAAVNRAADRAARVRSARARLWCVMSASGAREDGGGRSACDRMVGPRACVLLLAAGLVTCSQPGSAGARLTARLTSDQAGPRRQLTSDQVLGWVADRLAVIEAQQLEQQRSTLDLIQDRVSNMELQLERLETKFDLQMERLEEVLIRRNIRQDQNNERVHRQLRQAARSAAALDQRVERLGGQLQGSINETAEKVQRIQEQIDTIQARAASDPTSIRPTPDTAETAAEPSALAAQLRQHADEVKQLLNDGFSSLASESRLHDVNLASLATTLRTRLSDLCERLVSTQADILAVQTAARATSGEADRGQCVGTQVADKIIDIIQQISEHIEQHYMESDTRYNAGCPGDIVFRIDQLHEEINDGFQKLQTQLHELDAFVRSAPSRNSTAQEGNTTEPVLEDLDPHSPSARPRP